MVNEIIREIECALDNNLYLVALHMALTLPDMCARVQYPKLGNKDRYVKWYDEHIGFSDNNGMKDYMPKLTGDVVYNLRCSFLHEGKPNIDDRIKTIDKFILEKRKDIKLNGEKFGLYLDASSVIRHQNGVEERTYRVNIRGLCFKICAYAKKFYEENKNKFDFSNCIIVDMDEQIRKQTYVWDQMEKLLNCKILH